MIPRPSSVVREVEDLPQVYAHRNSSKCSRCFTSIQHCIVHRMEKFFYNYGHSIASRPYLYLLLCLVVTVACGSGFMRFKQENTGIKLWIPETSSQRINTDWIWEKFPPERRFASSIFVADDILVPEVIQAMYRVRKSIEEIVISNGQTWEDVCLKVPIIKAPDLSKIFGRKRRQVDDEDEFDQLFDQALPDNATSSVARSTTTKATTTSTSTTTTTKRPTTASTTTAAASFVLTESAFKDEEEDDFFKLAESDEGLSKLLEENPTSNLNIGEYYSIESYPEPYCRIANDMPKVCLELGLLELWAHDGKYDQKTDEVIANLTRESILNTINRVNRSGVYLTNKDFSAYLGGIRYDDTGKIIGAQASVIRWFSKMNVTDALINPSKERNEPVDKATLEFEQQMIEAMLNTSFYPPGLKSYPNVQRSFGDVAGSAILGDIGYMTIGFMIVYAYVMIMLGKFSCVEQRVVLSVMGIMGVVMGIIVSYGFCSAVGLFFGPMHNVLPFLLLGIGIDDMFVIVQSWDTLSPKDQVGTLPERLGRTLSHSGVAITITSITDVVAFAIGGTTVLPALRSFCLFASVGIVAIYWFQCTFFVAWMSLDQRRIENHRNGFCPCYQHKDYIPNRISTKNISQSIFNSYARLLMKGPSKVIVLLMTIVLTGFGIWGNVLLEQRFEPIWFVPPDTYLSNWFKANEKYFPFGGDRVTVWCHGLNFTMELEKLEALSRELSEQNDIIDEVESWPGPFLEYVRLSTTPASQIQLSDESFFRRKLTQFLYSPRGGKFRGHFQFDGDLICGQPAPEVLISDFTFVHRLFKGPSEHVPAMNRVKAIIRNANFSETSKVFPLSQGYAGWETDEVISEELYRNIALAVLCIFVTTIVLVGHFICSILVLIMVILSLADVGGFMHFWGLTIDTVSCINLIIAIGLCVDYSAHIAHRFLVERHGSREERVVRTLTNIGPAVMNGGISTFLAFILLANSQSHVFISFFKIFFLVVVFGLFQGLVVLPVVLSFIGPTSSSISVTPSESQEDESQAKYKDITVERNFEKTPAINGAHHEMNLLKEKDEFEANS